MVAMVTNAIEVDEGAESVGVVVELVGQVEFSFSIVLTPSDGSARGESEAGKPSHILCHSPYPAGSCVVLYSSC